MLFMLIHCSQFLYIYSGVKVTLSIEFIFAVSMLYHKVVASTLFQSNIYKRHSLPPPHMLHGSKPSLRARQGRGLAPKNVLPASI